MIQDVFIEYSPQWESIANSGIGGPVPYIPPTAYSATPATAAAPYLSASITGTAYTDAMMATHRPLMPAFFPDAIYHDFEYTIETSYGSDPMIQALESEAVYCYLDAAGTCWYCNNSLQFNYVNPAGMIQAYASANNPWADTGIVAGKFPVGVPTPVRINYLIDTVAHTYSTLAVSVGGKQYEMPKQFQGLPMTTKSPAWAPGVYVQLQLDLSSTGGSFTNKYSSITINWL